MLDREVRLARFYSECAADVPAARVVRVEHQGTIEQRHHGTDVLAEISQRMGGSYQNARVVAGHSSAQSQTDGRQDSFPITREKLDLIVLAGFMRVLHGGFVNRWQGRIVNIDPSMLPDFPGSTHNVRCQRPAGRFPAVPFIGSPPRSMLVR